MSLFDVRNLKMCYYAQSQEARAVQDVSFQIAKKEIVTLVGESGSGKSSVAHAMARLTDFLPCRVEGEINFKGRDILKASAKEIRTLRRDHVGYVFQEPAVALNPVFKVGDQLREAILKSSQPMEALLERVHLKDAGRVLSSYPHQLSGGMKQRVMIAMALGREPELLVADEPTTALDVTTQMGILELFLELKQKQNLSILFITHDLKVALAISDRILVMKDGRIAETINDTKNMQLKNTYAKRLWNAAQVGTHPKQELEI